MSRWIDDHQPIGGNAKLRAKLDACQIEAEAVSQWILRTIDARWYEGDVSQEVWDFLHAHGIPWPDGSISKSEDRRLTGMRLAEERVSVEAMERYIDTLETALVLMELERDAKRMEEGGSDGTDSNDHRG
jgi:hypothetical protein